MGFPSRNIVEGVRKAYPAGTRVELVQMDDAQAPPVGTHGTVEGVDDTGSIMVAWDNGSGLNVVYGEDIVKKLHTVKTICYGQEQIWDSREEAEEFFLKGMFSSEGSERDRYSTIFLKLKEGQEVCSDGCED